MSLPTLTVTPSAAADAYGRIGATTTNDAATGDPATGDASTGTDFGSVLARAVDGAVDVNSQAETTSMRAIAGHGSISDVVTALSRADLALQTTVAIRDRVVQAYQDIMRMPI